MLPRGRLPLSKTLSQEKKKKKSGRVSGGAPGPSSGLFSAGSGSGSGGGSIFAQQKKQKKNRKTKSGRVGSVGSRKRAHRDGGEEDEGRREGREGREEEEVERPFKRARGGGGGGINAFSESSSDDGDFGGDLSSLSSGGEENAEQQDGLFAALHLPQEKTQKQKQKQKQKKKQSESESAAMLFGRGGAAAAASASVQSLDYKTIAIGQSLLGAVRTVEPLKAEVSLPGMASLRGTIALPDASDVLFAALQQGGAGGGDGSSDSDDAMDGGNGGGAGSEDAAVLRRAGVPGGLRDVLEVGQLVRVVVSGLEELGQAGSNKYAVSLSMRESLVNANLQPAAIGAGSMIAASVRSIEDHGCVLEGGVAGLEVFLPNKFAPKGRAGELTVGQPLTVCVQEVRSAGADHSGKARRGSGASKRVVWVTSDPKSFPRKQPAGEAEGLDTLKTLKAGMLVSGRVAKVTGAGLVVSTLGGFFSGSVDALSVANYAAIQDPPKSKKGVSAAWLESLYQEGQRVRARVLWVDPSSKSIGLTLRKHIMDWRPFQFPENSTTLGAFVTDLRVSRLAPSVGATFIAPRQKDAAGDTALVFVHSNNVKDDGAADSQDMARFKPGSSKTYKARVLGCDRLNGVLSASLRPSVLSAEFLSVADVLPGMLLTGTVAEVSDKGVMVQIAPSIRGRFDRLHMLDSASLGSTSKKFDPRKKFHATQKVRVRVLDVEADSGRIHLTHKRTLVNSEDATIVDYANTAPGTIAHGFVINVADTHLLVRFYGGVVGLVGSSDIPASLSGSTQEKQAPLSKLFRIGQVLRTKVMTVQPDNRKMRLTLDMDADIKTRAADVEHRSEQSSLFAARQADEAALAAIFSPDADAADVLSVAECAVGSVWGTDSDVSLELSHIGSDGETLYFLVRLDGNRRPSCWAAMRYYHLADSVEQSAKLRDLLVQRLKVGKAGSLGWTLPVAVLRHSADTASSVRIEVTSKLSLVRAAKVSQFVSASSDLRQGGTYFGSVLRITDAGVVVELGGSATGFVHKTEIENRVVSDPRELFELGQTVKCYVLEVVSSFDRVKVSLSLKSSLCASSDAFFLESHFFVEDKMMPFCSGLQAADEIDWKSFRVGQTVDGKVKDVKSFGSVFSVISEPRLNAFALKANAGSPKIHVGEKVRMLVLDISPSKRILDIAVETDESDAARRGSSKVRPSTVVDGSICLVKQNYLIVRVSAAKGARDSIVFVPAHDWNEAHSFSPFSTFSVGQPVSVKIASQSQRVEAASVFRLFGTLKEQAVAAKPARGARITSGSSFEGSIPASHTLQVGEVVKAKILGVSRLNLIVALSETVTGRVHVTEISDDLADRNPLDSAKVGSIVDARVTGIREVVSKEKTLAITHQDNETVRTVVSLSMRSSILSLPRNADLPALETLRDLHRGDVVNGIIQSLTVDALWVLVSPSVRGRVFILDASDDITDLSLFTERFRVGQGLRCRVLSSNAKKGQLDLSVLAVNDEVLPKGGYEKFKKGDVVLGRVSKIIDSVGINVQIGAHEYGRVFLTDIDDCYKKLRLHQQFSEWQIVKCVILDIKKEKGKHMVDLSLRESRIDPEEFSRHFAEEDHEASLLRGERWQSEITSYDGLEQGQRVAGFVTRRTNAGVSVGLGRGISAFVSTAHLSDVKIRNPARVFPLGRMVHGVITDASVGKGGVKMSLKKSLVEPSRKRVHLSDVKPGDVLRGVVKSIVDTGVFVRVEHASFDAFVHVSALSDGFVQDVSQAGLSVGDSVRCVVLTVEAQRRRVGASMKKTDLSEAGVSTGAIDNDGDSSSESSENDDMAAAYFSDSDSSEDESSESNESESSDDDDDVLEGGKDAFMPVDGSSGSSSDDDEEMSSDSDDDVPAARSSLAVPWTAAADGGDGDEQMAAASDSDDDGAVVPDEDERRRLKSAHESSVNAAERAHQQLVEGERLPQTAAEFEEALTSDFGNSLIWVQYMGFFLTLSQVGKARALASRALRSIPQDKLDDRRNIWIALLNLESDHGTPESLRETFEKACQFNDLKDMLLHLADIYENTGRAGDEDNAAATWLTITKKFGGSARVWRKYAGFLCRKDRLDEFRSELDRALSALPRRKHAEIIVHAAVCEFRYGTAERGRTLFEGVVQAYPTRTDAWSVWLDQELRPAVLASPDHARRVFERVTSLSLSTKKMKYFFKRWLQFERDHGGDAEVQIVRSRAAAYVESKMK